MSKTAKLVAALERGERITLDEIQNRFGLKDPAVAMSDLRLRNGYAIENGYFVENGQTVRRWWLGVPPRHVVAAGYRALLNQSRK
jgi:hypothetical protein